MEKAKVSDAKAISALHSFSRSELGEPHIPSKHAIPLDIETKKREDSKNCCIIDGLETAHPEQFAVEETHTQRLHRTIFENYGIKISEAPEDFSVENDDSSRDQLFVQRKLDAASRFPGWEKKSTAHFFSEGEAAGGGPHLDCIPDNLRCVDEYGGKGDRKAHKNYQRWISHKADHAAHLAKFTANPALEECHQAQCHFLEHIHSDSPDPRVRGSTPAASESKKAEAHVTLYRIQMVIEAMEKAIRSLKTYEPALQAKANISFGLKDLTLPATPADIKRILLIPDDKKPHEKHSRRNRNGKGRRHRKKKLGFSTSISREGIHRITSAAKRAKRKAIRFTGEVKRRGEKSWSKHRRKRKDRQNTIELRSRENPIYRGGGNRATGPLAREDDIAKFDVDLQENDMRYDTHDADAKVASMERKYSLDNF
jgi:hypothetical protein